MVKAAIFDIDGLLINSEPLWKECEVRVLNAIGVPITYEMTDQTLGLSTPEAVRYWFQRYPWKDRTLESVGEELERDMPALIREKGQPMPGAHQAIAVCEDLGLLLAMASSSVTAIINANVEKLGVRHKFQVIHSAENEAYGKPHPAVYLSAATKLGVRPEECLAFEDSVNGVLSAKAARMHCIAVPEPHLGDDKRYGIADVVVKSLLDVTPDLIKSL